MTEPEKPPYRIEPNPTQPQPFTVELVSSLEKLDVFAPLEYPTYVNDLHESLFRSFQTLRLVEALLEKDTPPAVVLVVIRSIRRQPAVKETR